MSKDKPLNNRQLAALRSKNVQKASNLLTRLEKYASGTLTMTDVVDGKKVEVPAEISASQLKAAEIFLKKTMPDLQSIDSTTTLVDERSGSEIREEAKTFLMQAGMSEEQAEEALKKMAKSAVH